MSGHPERLVRSVSQAANGCWSSRGGASTGRPHRPGSSSGQSRKQPAAWRPGGGRGGELGDGAAECVSPAEGGVSVLTAVTALCQVVSLA